MKYFNKRFTKRRFQKFCGWKHQIFFDQFSIYHQKAAAQRYSVTETLNSCPDEIAFRRGLIDADQLRRLAEPQFNSGYGAYLLKILDQK
jgi:dTDP-glucose pyrophosphorylase